MTGAGAVVRLRGDDAHVCQILQALIALAGPLRKALCKASASSPAALQPAAQASSQQALLIPIAERPAPGPASSSCSRHPMACIAAPPLGRLAQQPSRTGEGLLQSRNTAPIQTAH